jgi:hypothetical protein
MPEVEHQDSRLSCAKPTMRGPQDEALLSSAKLVKSRDDQVEKSGLDTS